MYMDQLRRDDFEIVGVKIEDTEKISQPSLSYWKDALNRFRKNKLAMVGLVILILLIFMAIFWSPYFRI